MENPVFSTELGKKLLMLTKAGFVISNLLNDLVIREKVKGKILAIYETYSNNRESQVLIEEISALDNLLHLSSHLKLAGDNHIEKLRNGYLVFKSHIVLNSYQPKTETVISQEIVNARKPAESQIKGALSNNKSVSSAVLRNSRINERYEKVLNFIKGNNNRAQFSQLMSLFPGLSEKSLRNDLTFLCSRGKLKRIGWGPTSYYIIV